ncbi:porin family protein [Agarivorans sp. MS3-6]|uniref:porin family protein n=1 Tax=Agarivorans sp. TSD2052 TaxID=2937286 RepID=UPI00200F0C37|nr:porin family protein [Agarivorans sp. TSD2052]UPW16900.1 porin family protein [Agarivorans sp. TSD2052]
MLFFPIISRKSRFISFLLVATFLLFSTQPKASTATTIPWAAAFIDYQQATDDMLGITIAVNHYDKNYSRWGYYLGYAKSKQQSLPLDAPAQGQRDLTMLRIGLSYSLSNDISVYGGGALLEDTQQYTDGITLFCTDCEAEWHTDTDKRWGGEIGLRYAPTKHLIFGIGYNSAIEGGVFSLGYRG